jgi:hypothetical protein
MTNELVQGSHLCENPLTEHLEHRQTRLRCKDLRYSLYVYENLGFHLGKTNL